MKYVLNLIKCVIILLMLVSPAYAERISVFGGGLTKIDADDRYVNEDGDTMTGNLLLETGVKLQLDDEGKSYFIKEDNSVKLVVNDVLRQTWTTTPSDSYLLLENGDFFLLEDGGLLIL